MQRLSSGQILRMTHTRGSLISQRPKTFWAGNQRCPSARDSHSWSQTSANVSLVTTRKLPVPPPPCDSTVSVLASWHLAIHTSLRPMATGMIILFVLYPPFSKQEYSSKVAAAVAIAATVVAYKFLSSSLFGVGLEVSSFGICCHVHPLFFMYCYPLKKLNRQRASFYNLPHILFYAMVYIWENNRLHHTLSWSNIMQSVYISIIFWDWSTSWVSARSWWTLLLFNHEMVLIEYTKP